MGFNRLNGIAAAATSGAAPRTDASADARMRMAIREYATIRVAASVSVSENVISGGTVDSATKKRRNMAKRAKTARTRQTRGIKERKLNLPGFSAEASLGLRAGNYRGRGRPGASASIGGEPCRPTWRSVAVGFGCWRLFTMQGQWRRRSHMPLLRRPSSFTIGGLLF